MNPIKTSGAQNDVTDSANDIGVEVYLDGWDY